MSSGKIGVGVDICFGVNKGWPPITKTMRDFGLDLWL